MDERVIKEFENAAKAVARAYALQREQLLTERVVAIEGQVPSWEDIARYGRRVCYQDGRREWFWKKALILKESATPFTFDD